MADINENEEKATVQNAEETPVNEEETVKKDEETAAPEDAADNADSEEENADGENPGGKNKKLREIKKEVKALVERNRDLEDKVAEYDDKYKRMAAEYDNFRKRSAKEREAAYTDAYADALKEILPVIDNLERALGYAENADDKLAEGVKMTLKQFADTLVKMGVESYGEPGDKFDPEIHNAVMHAEDETKGENEITDVFQKGYRRGDKIIRYAMVKAVN